MIELDDSSVYKRLNGCCVGLRLVLQSDAKPSVCKWDLRSLDLQLILRHDIRSRLFFAKSLSEKALLYRLKAQTELPPVQVRCFDFLSLDHLPLVESNSEITCLMVNVATSSQEKAWYKFLAWTKTFAHLKCLMINDLTLAVPSDRKAMHDVRSSRFNLTYVKSRTLPGQTFMTVGDHPKAKLIYTTKPMQVWRSVRARSVESNRISLCTQLITMTQTYYKYPMPASSL